MTLSEIEQELQDIASKMGSIKSCVFGDEEEILNRQNTQMQYPCIWIETPSVRLNVGDGADRFHFNITFLQNAPNGDSKAARSARSRMLEIAREFWQALLQQSDESTFMVDSEQSEAEPIVRWSGDGDTGWRMPVSILDYYSPCEECNCD